MQLLYPNVRTPHLHPLPFPKGRGKELQTLENAEAVRHHPARATVRGAAAHHAVRSAFVPVG